MSWYIERCSYKSALLYSYALLHQNIWSTLVVVGGITCNDSNGRCCLLTRKQMFCITLVCVWGGSILTTVIVVYKVLQRTDHRCRVEFPTYSIVHEMLTQIICVHSYIRISLSMWSTLVVVGGIACLPDDRH